MMTEKNDEFTQECQLSEIDKLRHDLDEANEAKLRAMADFKNFQRRSVENELRASQSGVASVVKAMIPAIEHINLAIEHAQDDSTIQGFEMAKNELMKGLAECGVEVIQPQVGDPLDPHLHEAMMRQDADGIEPEHIVVVMQQGFRLGDIIISPARVAISN